MKIKLLGNTSKKYIEGQINICAAACKLSRMPGKVFDAVAATKDYDKALELCDEGLKMLEALPNGENYLMQYGYMLQVQQTLNFIMQDKYDEAYEAITSAYDNLSMTGGLTIQVRDLYALLALQTKDTKTFEALELEIDSYGDESIAFTSDVADYKSGKLTLKEIAESGRYDLI